MSWFDRPPDPLKGQVHGPLEHELLAVDGITDPLQQLHTVFLGEDYKNLSPRAIAAATTRTLHAIRPDVIAVNGWSVPEARAAINWGAGEVRTIVMSETKETDAPRVWWKESVKKRIISATLMS